MVERPAFSKAMHRMRMSNFYFIIITTSMIFVFLHRSCAQPRRNSNKSVKVAILGIYHMSGIEEGGLFKLDVDDVKSPKRQKEIQQLVNSLMTYNPSKILVESIYGNDFYVNRYKEFLIHQNEDSLSRNEIEQVGFRLAARLNHPTIYPFDNRKFLDPESLQEFISTDERFSEEFNQWMTKAGAFFKTMNNHLKTHTIKDHLKYTNSEEAINFHHQAYLEFMRYGRGNRYAGVDYSLDWYERNMKMFHNLTRITDFQNEEERILIIVEEAHVKILKNFIEDANYYEYVDILSFL
jgi:hypothetical protein